MVKGRIIFVLLLFAPIARSLACVAPAECLLTAGQVKEGTASDEEYGRWVGLTLGLCLIRDCRILLGTLQEVAGPEPSPDYVERRKQYYSKVVITVDEWLRRGPEDWAQRIRLDRVPMEMTRFYGTEFPGAVWSGVKLQVGSRLLIACYTDTAAAGARLNRINRYGLVISNEAIFPSVRATLDYHESYMSDADEIANVPALIHSSTDGVFSGYVASYLWRSGGGLPHTDASAFALSEIISEGETPGAVLLQSALIGVISDVDHPLSEGMRIHVIRRLVEAACCEKLSVAIYPIRVLLDLVAADAIKIEPFLASRCREGLAEHYRVLVKGGSVERQTAFERAIAMSP